jgi:very-short-patch-repair endonuclease
VRCISLLDRKKSNMTTVNRVAAGPEDDPDNKSRGEDASLIAQRLETARKELIETSTRSRLLHTPLGSPRAKILEVVQEDADQVFRALVANGKAMGFKAARNAGPEEGESPPKMVRVDRNQNDLFLQSMLPPELLQSRLRGLAYDADTIEKEQGVNILFLALGFLKWFEPGNDAPVRHAPLILVPVTLSRVSAAERFRVRYVEEELGTNLNLQARLQEFSIALPDLPDVEDLTPGSYFAQVAQAIRGETKWQVEEDRIAMGLFSFAKLLMYKDLDPNNWPDKKPIAKHKLVGKLLHAGFRGDPDRTHPDESHVDELIDFGDGPHVVDADSSQAMVIAGVRAGSDLVVQGPPGTGKSQTITNMMASAVRDGKTVLFVAEKMAALEVVRSNLARIGLDEMCLELHSHKARKKEVLESLQQTWSTDPEKRLDSSHTAEQFRETREALNAHARRMHTPVGKAGLTPFKIFGVLSRLKGMGIPSPTFKLSAAVDWNLQDLKKREQVIQNLADKVALIGIPARHPWRGVGLDAVLPHTADRYAARARVLQSGLADLLDRAEETRWKVGCTRRDSLTFDQLGRLAQALERAPNPDFSAIGTDEWESETAAIRILVGEGTRYENARAALSRTLTDDAWDEDFQDVRTQLEKHGDSLFRWARPDFRKAISKLRRYGVGRLPRVGAERLRILDRLEAGKQNRVRVRATDVLGRTVFGKLWQGEGSEWKRLVEVLQWISQCHSAGLPPRWRTVVAEAKDAKAFGLVLGKLASEFSGRWSALRLLSDDLRLDPADAFGGSTDKVTVDEICLWLKAAGDGPERIQEWIDWRLGSHVAHDLGLVELVEQVRSGVVSPENAPHILRSAIHETLADTVIAAFPDLASFDGSEYERTIQLFGQLDKYLMELAVRETQASHLAAFPRGERQMGEMAILSQEWRKQRRHLPLRELVRKAGRAMQAIKPVWMMSPMSLAQYVGPGLVEFDLVLMDEASQIRPVEALGAVARGAQLVVVGDEKQLPPTSFFDRVSDGAAVQEEEDDAPGPEVRNIESILGLCAAQGMNQKMLQWHYRSKHESLIAVSNLEFYKRLFIVPSADPSELGLSLVKVNGLYDRGRTSANVAEAKAVVKAVIEHAERYGSPERYPEGMSLGVGTFSVAQRDAILDELELRWRDRPELAEFFSSGCSEPFFVKNLESLQGDERDVIFISVGYGPDENGIISMNFGPLNSGGGERRLNVMISRARRQCRVFSSITAGDIDLSRTQARGVQVLRTFLQYAETGMLDRAAVGIRGIDSDFEEDVGDALAKAGYSVEHQIGVAGFFVDLAVCDPARPGRYLLGIECDGATYHSSRSARDRDRLREQVHRDRGWNIHRVWSTDWFRKRGDTLRLLIAAIEKARISAPGVDRQEGDSESAAAEDSGRPEQESSAQLPALVRATPVRERTRSGTVSYIEADFRVDIDVEPHELRTAEVLDILKRIVEIEAPVHMEELARRFATVCGRHRAGSRIQDAVKSAIRKGATSGILEKKGGFISKPGQGTRAPRNRASTSSVTLRNAAMISPIEIGAAIDVVVRGHIGARSSEVIVETARLLGFQRTGADLHEAIDGQLREMLGSGLVVLRNGDHLYAV